MSTSIFYKTSFKGALLVHFIDLEMNEGEGHLGVSSRCGALRAWQACGARACVTAEWCGTGLPGALRREREGGRDPPLTAEAEEQGSSSVALAMVRPRDSDKRLGQVTRTSDPNTSPVLLERLRRLSRWSNLRALSLSLSLSLAHTHTDSVSLIRVVRFTADPGRTRDVLERGNL